MPKRCGKPPLTFAERWRTEVSLPLGFGSASLAHVAHVQSRPALGTQSSNRHEPGDDVGAAVEGLVDGAAVSDFGKPGALCLIQRASDGDFARE